MTTTSPNEMKKKLEQIGIRATPPFTDELLILRYKHEGVTAYQIAESPNSPYRIVGTTRRRVNKIFEKELEILSILWDTDMDAIDEATYDEHYPTDLRLETDDITDRARYEDFQEAFEKAPKELWTFTNLKNLYPELKDEHILRNLVLYDRAMGKYEDKLKQMFDFNSGGYHDAHYEVGKFSGDQDLLSLLWGAYLRTINLEAPLSYVNCAVSVILAGIKKSNEHLKVIGENIIRYEIWRYTTVEHGFHYIDDGKKSEIENIHDNYFYNSFKHLYPTYTQWMRVCKSIHNQLEKSVRHQFTDEEIQDIDRDLFIDAKNTDYDNDLDENTPVHE